MRGFNKYLLLGSFISFNAGAGGLWGVQNKFKRKSRVVKSIFFRPHHFSNGRVRQEFKILKNSAGWHMGGFNKYLF